MTDIDFGSAPPEGSGYASSYGPRGLVDLDVERGSPNSKGRGGRVTCGTTTAYKRGCRCEDCRAAQSDYTRRYRAGRRMKKGRRFRVVRHGTLNAYVKRGCRCRECRLNWREYSRESARKRRGYQNLRTPHSICTVCGKDFALDKGIADVTCSHKCYSKAWRQRRATQKVWVEQPLSDREIEQREAFKREQIESAKSASAELAELVAAQERDERMGHLVSHRWVASLDAALSDGGSELGELIGSEALDPAVILEHEEYLSHLRAVTGGRSEEEIARLDYPTQQWLADKLRDEGLVGAISVRRAERERLREPQAHTGAKVRSAGSFGGKTKRREKVNARRHKRPSQKPPKRWSRDDWAEWENAA